MYSRVTSSLGESVETDGENRPIVPDAGKAFGHAVMEGTMARSEAGRSPAERGLGIVVLIIVTL